MSTPTMRKSVPLHDDDLAVVERIRSVGTVEYFAVREIPGVDLPRLPSEAETIHALVHAGIRAVEERVLADGYMALAGTRTDDDRCTAEAVRRRAASYTD